MDGFIEELAEAMRDYCVTRPCKRCLFKPVCDAHFQSYPSKEEWAGVMYDIEQGNDDDTEE